MSDAIVLTPAEISMYYSTRVPKLKRRKNEWRGACPIHQGKNDNFCVDPKTGRWYCHSACGHGGDILDLEAELRGGDFPTRKAEVFRLVSRIEPVNGHYRGHNWREVACYQYVDQQGRLVYEVVRRERGEGAGREKEFRQRRPDGKGGRIWNLSGVLRIPYRLPQLLTAQTVYLVEGEKDVHSLETWGLVASCNSGGSASSSLYSQWTEHFRGRDLFILPDRDPPGRKHAARVAEALIGAAASIRIVELPGLPEGGDFTDWRDSGGTLERFRELTAAATAIDAPALDGLRVRWGLAKDQAPQPAASDTGTLITRRLADIESRPVSWLWAGRIARGKLTIIAGNPGLGKSQITASIAAIVTTGGQWPVDRTRCLPGNVLFLTAEDDSSDTLRPRLEAAGGESNAHSHHRGCRHGIRRRWDAAGKGFFSRAGPAGTRRKAVRDRWRVGNNH
jgi:hypothetical protein